MTPIPAAMTVKMFADRFNFCTKTVYNMIQRGELTCKKTMGNSIRILHNDVLVWMGEEQCTLQEGEAGAAEGETLSFLIQNMHCKSTFFCLRWLSMLYTYGTLAF